MLQRESSGDQVLVRDNYISTLSRTEVWPDRDVGHWNAVPEIRWTRSADRVKSS